MSGLSYESLRERIRTAADASSGTDSLSPDDIPRRPPIQSFGDLFRWPRGGASDAGAVQPEPAIPMLELRLTRLVSGWGAIAGLILGAGFGVAGGVPSVFFGALLGTLIGSAGAIAGLVVFAGSAARLGATWALTLAAIFVLWTTWLVTR